MAAAISKRPCHDANHQRTIQKVQPSRQIPARKPRYPTGKAAAEGGLESNHAFDLGFLIDEAHQPCSFPSSRGIFRGISRFSCQIIPFSVYFLESMAQRGCLARLRSVLRRRHRLRTASVCLRDPFSEEKLLGETPFWRAANKKCSMCAGFGALPSMASGKRLQKPSSSDRRICHNFLL